MVVKNGHIRVQRGCLDGLNRMANGKAMLTVCCMVSYESGLLWLVPGHVFEGGRVSHIKATDESFGLRPWGQAAGLSCTRRGKRQTPAA